MQQLVFVFLGGGIGSVLRCLIGLKLNSASLAYGTFIANVLGSLLIGLLMGYHLKATNNPLSQNQMTFLIIGVLGGFTTFSSFMYENLQFLIQEQYLRFVSYSLASIVLGLSAVFVGFLLGKLV